MTHIKDGVLHDDDGNVLHCQVCNGPGTGFLGRIWVICEGCFEAFKRFRDEHTEIKDGVSLWFAFCKERHSS